MVHSYTSVCLPCSFRTSLYSIKTSLQEHSCVLHSIIGWHTDVGMWARVEGTPIGIVGIVNNYFFYHCLIILIGPNPNIPFAKLESKPLFKPDGRLNPSITILGEFSTFSGHMVKF